MKIAVPTRFAHTVGGVETYLGAVLPALGARGHDVRVWHEYALSDISERMVPSFVHVLQISRDTGATLDEIRAWGPDAIFLNGLSDPDVETRLSEIAPLLILLHAYHGTCISGTKTLTIPTPQVCSRPLGPGCLVNYFPRRCGGWSPATMVTSYVQQRVRQRLLRNCTAVATLSEHMRAECIAQGVAPERVSQSEPRSPRVDAPVHLLFMGRMERLKGGHLLLDAIDRLDATHRKDLVITFVGEGRERRSWEHEAARVSRGECEIRFTGWLRPAERLDAFKAADLLVCPSVWPEPYGLVGLEAAAVGVPALAFDVGGIREWLTDSVTGRLVAPSHRPADALTRALEDCLSDRPRLHRWGAHAYAAAQARSVTTHIDALEHTIEIVAGSVRPLAGVKRA